MAGNVEFDTGLLNLTLVVIIALLTAFAIIFKRSFLKGVFKKLPLKLKKAIVLLLSLLICLIILNPKVANSYEKIKTKGINVVFAVDLSLSMWCTDVKPTRYHAALSLIQRILFNKDISQAALVGFSGYSAVAVPLTEDTASLYDYLRHIRPGDIEEGGTNLYDALMTSLLSTERKNKRKSNIVILISDGEKTKGRDPMKAITEYKKRGVFLITVGIGSKQGSYIPQVEGNQIVGWITKNGKYAISRPNFSLLKKLAEETGGVFVKIEDKYDVIPAVNKITQFIKRNAFKLQTTKRVKSYRYLTPSIAALGIIIALLIPY